MYSHWLLQSHSLSEQNWVLSQRGQHTDADEGDAHHQTACEHKLKEADKITQFSVQHTHFDFIKWITLPEFNVQTEWKRRNTLVMTLAALKQSKLARIVYHSKLLQQSLDDLSSRSARAYVQVLGCILWQVERGAALHATSFPPSSIVTSFLWRWNWHRSRQLELHLNEASVGTILVLLRKINMLQWSKNTH